MRLASATAEISMLGRLDEQANRLKTILSDIVPLQPHYPIYAVEGRLLFEIDTLASSVVSLLRERLTDLSAGVDPKRAALANYLLGLHGKGPFLDTISRSAENLALPPVALDPSALLNAFAQTLADWRTKLPPTIGLFRPFAALRSLQAPTPRPVETLIRENLDQRVAKLYQDALDSQKKTEAAKSSCPPSHSEIEMLAHAKLAYKNKDFRLAIEWGNQLNEAYPGRPVTETLLGDAYFYLDQEHPDHAFRHYANALALGGQLTPQGLFRYGHAAFLSGHLDAAEQAFRSALRYQPDDPHLLQTLAGLLDAKGQPREAAGCHRTAIYLGANAAALDQSYRYGVMRRDRTLQKLALERALPAASTPEAAALWRLRALDQATADRDWSLVRELLDRDGAETQTPSGIFYRLLAALEKGRKKVVAAVFKDRPLPRLLPSAVGKEYAAEVGVDPLLTLMTRAAWNLVQRSPTASIAALLAREVLEERPGEPLAEATLFELACREERWRGALEQVKHLPALQPLFRQILSALQTEITTDQMPGPTELRLKKQLGLPTPRREAHEGLAASRAPLREKLPPAPEPVRGHRSSLAIRTGDAWMRRADAFYLLEEYTAALGGYQAAMNAFLPYSAKAAEAAFRAVSVAIDQEDHLEAMKTLTLALKAPFNDRESYARLYRLHLDIHPGGLGKNMAVALADCQRLDD